MINHDVDITEVGKYVFIYVKNFLILGNNGEITINWKKSNNLKIFVGKFWLLLVNVNNDRWNTSFGTNHAL